MRWSWPGAVALVLASCVGVGWAVAIVIAAVHPGSLSSGAAQALHTLGGALVGGVVAWLSSTRRRGDGDDDPPPD